MQGCQVLWRTNICPLADFGGLGGPAGGLADWWRPSGGLWRTGGSATQLAALLCHPRRGSVSVSFLATPREGHNSSVSVSQFLATPREGGTPSRTSGGLPADFWRTSGGLLADSGGLLADFWRTSGGLLADFWRTFGGLADFWRTGLVLA
eukprot:gene16027-biopygen7136